MGGDIMKCIGRRLYYDVNTGHILIEVGERKGYVVETTVEQDIQTFKVLSARVRESFDYIQLEYGQYAQDFAESNGYRVNPATKELEFSYPDPNDEEPQEPVYQLPLSKEVEELKKRIKLQDATMEELMFVVLPKLTGGI